MAKVINSCRAVCHKCFLSQNNIISKNVISEDFIATLVITTVMGKRFILLK